MARTIYVVFKTGRQVDGEYIFISAEKAYIDPTRAEEYWRKQVNYWRETIEGVQCDCERAIHPVELEE